MNFKKKNAANAPAPNQAQQAARRRSLRSGAYASVLAVVVLVLVILLNLVVGAVPTKFTQFDISTGKMFTLSDTTKTMLQELNTDVTAYYLAETGNEDSNITRILDRYAGESSHFTWQQRDPALYPTFAQQYDAQNASSSSVILVCGDNHTVVDYNDMYTADYSSYYTTGSYTMSFSAEKALSSGIAKVTRENSYVLYQLTQYQLAHLLLPVGDYDKPAIRENAREAGLLNADKSDSQDICFVPDGDYVSFLQSQGVTLAPGDFVDEAGHVLGQHRGLPCYTIGQGKGLGIAVGKHVYVLAKNEADNTVVLGDNDKLFRRELTANRVNWIAGEAPAAPFRCTAKTRYSQVEAPALAEPLPDGRVRLTFDEPQRAITAGQAAVLYDGDEVLGGGTIE